MSDETLGIPTYVSLCSGYDGIGLGLKRVIPNLQTLAHCEIEAYAIAGLISKMEAGQLDACPVFSDISDFPFEDLRGKLGILSAGFPCQPFSSAGRRQATEDPRHIYPRIADGISVCLPQYVFLENVRGIVSAKTADGESVLKYVLGDLESRGYRTEFGLFSAEETGAPHQRIRCFILAKLPDTCGKGLQGYEFGGTRSLQVEGIQGTHESTSELHQVRDEQLGNPASERPRGGSENCEGEQSEVLGTGLESDGELANPASREPRQSQARNGGQDLGGGSEETQWPARPGEEQYEWEEPRVVADSKVKRCGGRKNKDGENGEGISEQEGEERSILRGETEGCCGDGETANDETQSELGGATDGPRSGVDPIANRVDRLRLLGNGVVPSCAELAWRTLWKQLNDKYDD